MDVLKGLTALGRFLGGDNLACWGPPIMLALPSLLFLPSAIARLFELCFAKLHVSKRDTSRILPMFMIAIWLYMNVLQIMLKAGDGKMRTAFDINPAAVVIGPSAILVLIVSLIEEVRQVRPSALLTAYLATTSIFEIFMCIWWSTPSAHPTSCSQHYTLPYGTALAGIGVKLVGIISTQQPWLFWDEMERRIETATDFVSLAISHWMSLSNLSGYAPAHPDNGGKWADFDIPGISGSLIEGYSLFKPLSISLRVVAYLLWHFVLSIWPHLCLLALQGAQYVYVIALLERLYKKQIKYENEGIIFSSVCASIFLSAAIFSSYAGYYNRRAGALTRAFLSQLIFDKMTTLTATTTDDAIAMTLLSTDVVVIEEATRAIQTTSISVIKVLLACWVGSEYLTPAFFIPLVICISTTLLFALMIGLLNSREFQWFGMLQDRLRLTIETMTNLRPLRLQITSEDSSLYIQALREDEIHVGSKGRKTMYAATSMGFLPSLLLPSLTFIFTHKVEDITSLYASVLGVVSVLSPLASLYQSFPAIIGGVNSYRRILAYLKTPPQASYRTPLREEIQLPYAEVAFDMHDASFGWSQDEMVLNGLCVQIPRGCMTVIVGPCASGKSSLCTALLGEMPVATGSIKTPFHDKPASYCAQSPFIMDATFQENITGFSNFNQDRYDEAVWATMLEDDAARLPLGHDTMVGDQTGILSTGLRARISLARAIYAGNELVILDNSLNGMDLAMEDEIFARVFGPEGVLTERGCTVIFVTHWMHHVTSADHIIALGDRGVIQEQGTLNMLIERGGYIFDMAVSYRTPLRVKHVDLASTTRYWPGPRAGRRKVEVSKEKPQPRKTYLENDTSDVASYYWEPANNDWGLAVFLLASLYMLAAAFCAIWLSLWTYPHFSGSKTFYVCYYGFIRGVELILLATICAMVVTGMASAPSRVIHKQIIKTLCLASPNFVAKCNKGALLSYFAQDIVFTDRLPAPTFVNMIIHLGVLLGAMSAAAYPSPWVVFCYPIVVFILYQFQLMVLRGLKVLRQGELLSRDTIYTQILDANIGLSTIRSTGWIGDQRRRHKSLADASQRLTFIVALAQEWAQGAATLLVGMIFMGLCMTGLRIRDQSGFTATCLITLVCVVDNFPNMFQCFSSVEAAMGGLRRLLEFENKVKPESEGETSDYSGYNWPAGSVKIQSISASYATTTASNQQPGDPPIPLALNNLTLNVNSGERVAITGPSGSGKTALMHLLLRVLDPLQGARDVRVDGKRLSQLRRDKARRQILALPFENVFLPGRRTIRENMTLNTRLRDKESVEALKLVGLEKWLEENGGLDAVLMPWKLSKGQQTLFGLARLVLVQRQLDDGYHSMNGLLMLEEVDAHLDHDLRRVLRNLFRGRLRPCTLILISHRMDLARDICNRVVAMDRGRVVKDGDLASMCQAHKVTGPCLGDGA